MKETVLIRVWPDGTYQSVDEEPYAWMSDDYEVLSTTFCDHCGEPFDAGRRAAQTEVHILREWIKGAGDQYDICTRNVLKEICDGCRCRNGNQGGNT